VRKVDERERAENKNVLTLTPDAFGFYKDEHKYVLRGEQDLTLAYLPLHPLPSPTFPFPSLPYPTVPDLTYQTLPYLTFYRGIFFQTDPISSSAKSAKILAKAIMAKKPMKQKGLLFDFHWLTPHNSLTRSQVRRRSIS